MIWTGRLRLGLAVAAAAASVGVLTATPAAAGVHARGSWGAAITVPGIAKLNNGGSQVISMSCPASGDCAAVGTYQRRENPLVVTNVFVADETGGTWGNAVEFPGLAVLNHGQNATVNQVSCGAPGDCAAGGSYTDASGSEQGWLAVETGGVWQAAQAVNGLAARNQGGFAAVTGVSCPAGTSGDCTAAGHYTNGQAAQLGFTISETGGTWGTATPIPGQSVLPRTNPNNIGIFVTSLSCAPRAAGNCAVTGTYFATFPVQEAFVADSAGGVWADAEQIPGSAALNVGGDAQGDAVSCPLPGDCSLGGTYNDGSPATQGFVAQQSGGVWANAEAVPGLATLNKGGFVAFNSLSCGTAGDCAAGGDYSEDFDPPLEPTWVVTETGGVWGQAEQVPGLAALSDGNFESLQSVSCSSAGTCAAGGYYSTATAPAEAFVANETGGIWHAAQEVPGTAALDTGRNASTFAVSCAPGGSCALGGDYRHAKPNRRGHEQAFVDNQG